MMSSLLQDAIQSIRAGDKGAGQRLLAQVLQSDPGNETAWLWMTEVVGSDEERARCLQRVLEINPGNETARRGLAALRQSVPLEGASAPQVEPPEPAPVPIARAAPPKAPRQAPPETSASSIPPALAASRHRGPCRRRRAGRAGRGCARVAVLFFWRPGFACHHADVCPYPNLYADADVASPFVHPDSHARPHRHSRSISHPRALAPHAHVRATFWLDIF